MQTAAVAVDADAACSMQPATLLRFSFLLALHYTRRPSTRAPLPLTPRRLYKVHCTALRPRAQKKNAAAFDCQARVLESGEGSRGGGVWHNYIEL